MTMLQRVEFYNCPDGSINIQRQGDSVRMFDESCTDIYPFFMIRGLPPIRRFLLLPELFEKLLRYFFCQAACRGSG